MNKAFRVASLSMYACTALLLILYLIFDFSCTLAAHDRLFMLGAICVLGYSASFFLAKTAKKANAETIMKITFWVFFVLYIHLLLTLVLFDKYFGRLGISALSDITKEGFTAYMKSSVNLVPFSTISKFVTGAFIKTVSPRAVIINIFGNLAAFAPFAFFMPLLFKKMRSFKSFLLFMVCTVCAVEILQLLLLTGACDIDDLILNVGGACLAYLVLNIRSVKQIIEKIIVVKV